MDLGLPGKTVIVTGGGSNIGRATVLTFAAEGANVVCADIDKKIGRKTVDEANSLGVGGRAVLTITDVTDEQSIDRMVNKALEEFGQIDVLVNNAGGSGGNYTLPEVSVPQLLQDHNLTFWSNVRCSKAIVPHMIARKQGTIVNVGSNSGRLGTATSHGYSSAKGAVIAFTKSLARELSATGIRVNCVCPGMTLPKSHDEVGAHSSWTKHAFDRYANPQVVEQYLNAFHLTRVGEAQDISNMVVFLASDCASFMTGQTISVDGGETML